MQQNCNPLELKIVQQGSWTKNNMQKSEFLYSSSKQLEKRKKILFKIVIKTTE